MQRFSSTSILVSATVLLSSSTTTTTLRDGSAAIASLSAAVAADNAAIDDLFRAFRCRHVYLDVGTNAGVQIRKLYEPSHYRGARVLPTYRRAFGEEGPWCSVCAIGFEPNPSHKPRLAQLERTYRAAGAPVLIFNAAAADADGITTISSADLSAGATLSGAIAKDADPSRPSHMHKVRGHHTVRAIDLSRVIMRVRDNLYLREEHHARGGHSGRILMKMDIEGAEFSVLPSLIRSLAICAIHEVFVEWHSSLFDKPRVETAAKALQLGDLIGAASAAQDLVGVEREALTIALQNLTRTPAASSCRLNRLSVLDDESYSRDPKPWPVGRLCS